MGKLRDKAAKSDIQLQRELAQIEEKQKLSRKKRHALNILILGSPIKVLIRQAFDRWAILVEEKNQLMAKVEATGSSEYLENLQLKNAGLRLKLASEKKKLDEIKQ